ncbi:MAG: YcgL domain-containing protein [Gammaproteobacteria bacterium]|nr:YcgL domain-containing protein [Gammaproteobacteria bacterium]
MAGTTRCWIYRSPRRAEMYLYLREENQFEVVPKPLLKRFGTPVLVMELELHPQRQLAREDVESVVNNLQTQGFHLQMPPEIRPDLYLGD